jgi:DNA-binding transcriptional regulator YhcF (GntR family)
VEEIYRVPLVLQRLAMVQATLHSIWRVVNTFAPGERIAIQLETAWVVMHIFEGQAQSRPRTQTMLAKLTSMPRQTLDRRLRELIRANMVRMVGRKRYVLSVDVLKTIEQEQQTRRLIRDFIETGRGLEELNRADENNK